MCRSVSTGQLQNGGNVTEEVVNLIRMTEMQRDLARLPCLHWDSTDPGAHSQLEAHLWGHDQGIVQRVTDGHTEVIGHTARRRHSVAPRIRKKHIWAAQFSTEMLLS